MEDVFNIKPQEVKEAPPSIFDFGVKPSQAAPQGVADTVKVFSSTMSKAKEEGKKKLMIKLAEFGLAMLKQLFGFLKKSFEIAVYKFAVELCAMIMTAILGAMIKKGNRAMDITTPGVLFHGGQPVTGQQQNMHQTRSLFDNNPFGGDWGRGSVAPSAF